MAWCRAGQALAGILLPSATVFLLLLCNDRDVLGPWVNTRRRNFFTAIVIWVLVLLSLALTAATLFKNISATTLQVGFITGIGVGAIGGAVMWALGRRSGRGAQTTSATNGCGAAEPSGESERLAADLGLTVSIAPGASRRERRREAPRSRVFLPAHRRRVHVMIVVTARSSTSSCLRSSIDLPRT